MITVDGRRVGFMYREPPMDETDSGWRFTAGIETHDYMHDLSNHAAFDVNTIANYDPDIVPFLNAPVGTAFERSPDTGEFQPVPDFEYPRE